MNKKFWVYAAVCTMITSPAYSFDYEQCTKSAKTDNDYADCMKTESSRLMNLIKKEYEQIGKDSRFKAWDKGKLQNSNNLKKLFNDWLNYRDSYCSLYTLSMSNYMGSDDYNQQKCVYDITERQYNYIKLIIQNANSEIVGS